MSNLILTQSSYKFFLFHKNRKWPNNNRKGTGHSSSLISLPKIEILNITNSDSAATYSNLINALALTIQLFSVHISNFTSRAHGVFFLVNASSQPKFSAMHCSASANVTCLNMFSTISMSDIYCENVARKINVTFLAEFCDD